MILCWFVSTIIVNKSSYDRSHGMPPWTGVSLVRIGTGAGLYHTFSLGGNQNLTKEFSLQNTSQRPLSQLNRPEANSRKICFSGNLLRSSYQSKIA